MGYYTAYNLSILADDGFTSDADGFYNDLRSARGGDDGELEELIRYGAACVKLYDIEEDISQIAPKYPHLLIILEGDGDEKDDRWEYRWKGTNHEYHEMEMPPFTNPNLQIP